jgi:Ca2+/Na+ antiporter
MSKIEFETALAPDSHRKMWLTYAEFRIKVTRHDIRKMLWRLIAILVLNAVFFAVTRSVIFVWLILLAFPLFAIFMRLSYRRARKAKAGIEKWLEEEKAETQQLKFLANEELIQWKRKDETTSFHWKKCVFSHEEEDVLMVFDGKSKLLFMLSRAVLGLNYNALKELVMTHTRELMSKTIL